MRKILLIIPLFLFGFKMMMHPEDPKSRDHNSLGFGVAGDVEILDGTFFVGQTGSSLNNGSVYVYNENGESKLDLVEVFPPNNLIYGYSFGHSINTLNDNLLVGSPHRTNAEGKVFLYERSNKEWNLLQELIPAISNVTSNFGSEVVITDKHIFVADQYYDEEKGAVFHFIKDPINNKWKYESVITHTDIQEDGYFGHSISVKGDRLLIGSRNGNLAVLYEFNNLIWEEKRTFKAEKYQSKGRYGYSVELSDNKVIIGYPGYNSYGAFDIYQLENESWIKKAEVINPNESKGSYFASSISIFEDNLLVGDYNGEKSYLFKMIDNDYSLIQIFDSPDIINEGKFGRTVDIKSGQLIIGATYGEKAYIYDINESGTWLLSNNISSDNRNQSITGQKIPCENGLANNYDCKNLDLMSFLSPSELSNGNNTELNDIWGWTDSTTSKEYALVGLLLGVSFVDVTDPINPFVIGVLPTETVSSLWRDIKVYKDHAFIVADNVYNHGIQIFDLTQLRGVTDFTVFEKTYHYDKVGSVHNLAINEETGFAYAVGVGSASKSEYMCGAHIIDINDPSNPTYSGCLGDESTGRYNDGYVHDGQFVIYRGPDSDYYGKEIAFTCNETALGIADVTDKSNLKIISKYDQLNFGYVHQGWLSEDHRYFFVNDELNEYYGNDPEQTTVIFDVSDLDAPKVLTIYKSGLNTIDHNNYVVGNLLYQSNYSTGLRVLNINNVEAPVEVAYFDTYRSGDIPSFVGSWSNYPYFSSGTIIVSSIEEGLFILKASEGGSLSINENPVIPEKFELKQNYPNPFNPTTQIQYELPQDGNISLIVYNMLGENLIELDKGFKMAGTHKVTFDGSMLPSGIYLYQLRSGDFIRTKKMTFMK
jgi:choice-of-anchor B domain-containing protein|tara:strand:- start:100 stop:2727 length:2628 start_codon:yes stop_codon:yes gene_type:complete